jgi:hypothetical protein
MVLMPTCDANLIFTLFDVGAYGKEGDSSIYASSNISAALENNTLGLPGYSTLIYSDPPKKVPHFFTCDDAFPLKPWAMKPYPGRLTGLLSEEKRIYNYRCLYYIF